MEKTHAFNPITQLQLSSEPNDLYVYSEQTTLPPTRSSEVKSII